MDNNFTVFSETFKAKINIFSVLKHAFSSWLSFAKIVRISTISIIKKGVHLNFAMCAILHKYAIAYYVIQ